jgi:hypothetical protein
MPPLLRQLRPRTMPIDVDAAREMRLHPALLARVRERLSKDTGPELRAHLAKLDRTLSARTRGSGPMDEEELAIERQLDERELKDVPGALQHLERQRGKTPAIRYLHARLALLRGEEPARSVAQKLSEIADEEKGFHQAALVAARTWLAAGEEAHARYFARRLVEDPSASDSERLVAQEILATVPSTTRSMSPPSVVAELVTEIPPTARIPRMPRLGDAPPPQSPPTATIRPPAVARTGTPPPGARGAMLHGAELAESLPLPAGSSETDLGVNDRPTTPAQARIAMIRLARDLARDYRLWYGKALRCDVIAIDGMQQHLAQRYEGASIADEEVAWELRRHGALLSEILARKLGGVWVDVGPSEPGYWAMLLGPELRTHPIGRVYRFVSLGPRERDLVSYFIDLEGRLRQS